MRDLTVGHRRTGQPRPWRAALIGLGLLAAAGVVTWFIFERSVTYEPPADPGDARGAVHGVAPAAGVAGGLAYRDAQLQWNGGIAVLRLGGAAHSMGAAHGHLLADQVRTAVDLAEHALDGLVRGHGGWARFTHELRVAWRLRFLDDGLNDVDRGMVAGMVRGAELAAERYQQLVRLQATWDLGAAISTEASGLCRTLTVVGLQEGASAGRVWIGHQFAAPGLDDGGESLTPVVVFAHPQGGLAWAALSWPGSAGVATGINAKGIVVVVNPARTRDVRPTRSARPILLLARSVLEHASTLDEAVRTLESTSTLGAASYLVVDGHAGKWAVVERSPARAVVTRSTSALALGDYLSSSVFAADPENDRAHRMTPSAARVARAQQLLRLPLASVEQLAAVLRDRRTPDDVPRALGHRGVPFDPAAQSSILDPALMILWVADPSAAGRMRAFDLRYELEGVGDRAAPPPDIAADPGLELEVVAQVQAARRELRRARAALAAGHLVQARQLADRAVARAPALPEALELAGQLAARTGDRAGARGLLQRWLDGGPDDPDQEQKIRSQLASDTGW